MRVRFPLLPATRRVDKTEVWQIGMHGSEVWQRKYWICITLTGDDVGSNPITSPFFWKNLKNTRHLFLQESGKVKRAFIGGSSVGEVKPVKAQIFYT